MTIKTDFDNGPLEDWGVMVTRIPVTVTTSETGQKTYSDETSEEIKVVFMGVNQKFALDKPGLTEKFDAKIFVKSDQTINKYDKIIHKNKVYMVEKVNRRKFMGTLGFLSVGLFMLKNE